jgi:hypothetical protein
VPAVTFSLTVGEPGTLETILDLLPTPIKIKLRGIILIVVDYETWKDMVRQKQSGEGS